MYKKFIMFENYEIKIKNETALGGKYIGIDPGSGQANGIKYAVADFNKILSGKRSGDLLSELTDMISENRPDIRKSVRNFEEITAKINSGQGTFGKLLNENKVYDNTDDLVSEVRQTLEDTREQAPITSFIKAALGFL
jgi:phospholipid/cholesterol/gamma-HCH transport system substrate-binding protein